MTKKRQARLEFEGMGTVRSAAPALDGKRLDFKATISVSPDFFAGMNMIANAETDNIFEMARLLNKDPKTFYSDADMTGFEFLDAGAEWEDADLRWANFTNTTWKNTSLKRALLYQADFTGAVGLTEEDFAGAYITDRTKLPAHIDRARVLEMHVALNLPTPCVPSTQQQESLILQGTGTLTDTTPPVPVFKM